MLLKEFAEVAPQLMGIPRSERNFGEGNGRDGSEGLGRHEADSVVECVWLDQWNIARVVAKIIEIVAVTGGWLLLI